MVLKIIRAESGNDSLGVTKRQMYSRAAGQDDRSLWNRVWKAAVLAVCISPKCGQVQQDLLRSSQALPIK